jgi:hypothetical protein
MVNFPGRNGRRRRVLNDDVLSASGAYAARQSTAAVDAGSNAPRYSDAAGVENHPQVTDFVPRRYRTIVLLVLFGLATAVTTGALHHFAPAIAPSAGMPDLGPVDLASPSSLAAWVSAVILFLASAACLLVYSIRRHRIDDYRGRYRIWLAATAVCLVLSANSIVGLHQVLAHTLSYFTGWTALRDGAAWWLLVCGPPLAWIAVRVLVDVKECRLAASLLVAALAAHTTAAATYFGFMPTLEPRLESLISGVTVLLGHWFTFSAVVSYARYVVLDAQGLVAVRRPTVKKPAKKTKAVAESRPTPSSPSLLSAAGYKRQTSQPASAADADRWVDGSRPERDSYDDDDDESTGPTKLSKADRKRLRKLKAQNRAA